jgi:hypothetical protein
MLGVGHLKTIEQPLFGHTWGLFLVVTRVLMPNLRVLL